MEHALLDLYLDIENKLPAIAVPGEMTTIVEYFTALGASFYIIEHCAAVINI